MENGNVALYESFCFAWYVWCLEVPLLFEMRRFLELIPEWFSVENSCDRILDLVYAGGENYQTQGDKEDPKTESPHESGSLSMVLFA